MSNEETSRPQMSVKVPGQMEMFVRYDKSKALYYVRLGENSDPIEMSLDKVGPMLASDAIDARSKQVLKFLFDEAVKDKEGRWVSASSAPTVTGQALV